MHIELPIQPVSDQLAAEIQKQGVFVSKKIRSLRVADARTSVIVQLDQEADVAEVRGKVERFLEGMGQGLNRLESRVLTRSRRSLPDLVPGVFEELKSRGWVLDLGRGQVGLAGPALRLLRALDASFARLAERSFDAQERSYPVLVPSQLLAKTGYFSSFPHSIFMVTHVEEDFDSIEGFRSANSGRLGFNIPNRDHLALPPVCVSPALCFQAYHSLEGQRVRDLEVITTQGHCARYESTAAVGLERLWDFQMRELIFIGSADAVETARRRALQCATDQLDEWGLEFSVQTASDPFFSSNHERLSTWQREHELKLEIRAPIRRSAGGADDIAVVSINAHRTFLGERFRITAPEGGWATTSCLGWGLERFVLAVFTQLGLDPSAWPAALRSAVS
jgi:seryl-tRNA synthetase